VDNIITKEKLNLKNPYSVEKAIELMIELYFEKLKDSVQINFFRL
jgi:hypothetical protein